MARNFLWITRTEENLTYYAASARKTNLSLRFASDIAPSTKKRICDFVRYISITRFTFGKSSRQNREALYEKDIFRK